MEQTQQQKKNKQLPKLNFKPCNTYLLCRKIELDDRIGNIIIPDPDKLEKRFEVVAASPDLIPSLDHYDVGDILIYPTHQPPMYINVDGEDYWFLDKRMVVTKA